LTAAPPRAMTKGMPPPRASLVLAAALVAAASAACTEREKSSAATAPATTASASAAPSASAPVIVEPSTSRLAPVVYAGNGPCPPDMAAVTSATSAFCIDRYEAPNVKGEYPLVMESALTAEKWCVAHGKRLCQEDEWERACAGADGLAYPYGNTHEEARCADEKTWIDKDESTITMWPEKPAMGEVTRLYQAERSGSRPECISGYGVFDMTGNVEEWVVSTKKGRAYEHVLKGCYWSGCYGGSKPTCGSTNAAHADTFKFYETGFRCCKNAARSP
jgi:hypothetical protein